ncbi:hypothetical protein [Paenibacillus massiliensis]|uniref:hypothetical protein n=1 Tax=Paenibacillus massiliensis TaxID=225917 RepID=UPI000471C8DA|nr:hypothetical protein [Paenibacillus massiliensis]
MTENTGHMAYDFEGLERQVTWSQAEARELFLHYFALKNSFSFSTAIDYEALDTVLQDECYLVFNHEPRYKGRQLFFTGHGVQTTKEALLHFMKGPIEQHDLIIPLLIIPVVVQTAAHLDVQKEAPAYIIATQEDPVFEIWRQTNST